MARWRLLHGDCVEWMRKMREASVDAIVCDPPYELAFMGKSWDAKGIAFDPATWREALRVLKPGGHLLAFGGTRTFHRMTCAIEDAGFEIRDCLSWLYGTGFPKSLNLDGASEGWGTALKPAYEPIVMARKPLMGTVAANVQAHGTGAINIAACRIGFAPGDGEWHSTPGRGTAGQPPKGTTGIYGYFGADGEPKDGVRYVSAGRWPANVVLDEEAGAMLDAQSGLDHGGNFQAVQNPSLSNSRGAFAGTSWTPRSMGTGGASRFFYCAKASRSERNDGLPGSLPNQHPTVKPLALMRWLARLVTPPDGLVLDPFAGSGTTGVACMREGFRFAGIEQSAEYLEIARCRLEAAALEPAE